MSAKAPTVPAATVPATSVTATIKSLPFYFLIIHTNTTEVGFNSAAETAICTDTEPTIKANTKSATKSLVVNMAQVASV
jgi:hypothetical protein